MSIQYLCQDSSSRPSDYYESPPLTTRPGLPPLGDKRLSLALVLLLTVVGSRLV